LTNEKTLKIKESLHGVGLSDDEIEIQNENTFAYIEIKVPIDQELQTYLRQSLGIEVLAS